MKLTNIIRNLLAGRAHDAVVPVITPLEAAILESINKEPHMWRISKAHTPDRGNFLLANNGEKGFSIGSQWSGEPLAWSGKLEFSHPFAELWASTVDQIHQSRIAAETKMSADATEKQIKAAFKL